MLYHIVRITAVETGGPLRTGKPYPVNSARQENGNTMLDISGLGGKGREPNFFVEDLEMFQINMSK